MRTAALGLAALAVALAGCTAGSHPGAHSSQRSGPSLTSLRQAAELHRCPATRGSPAGETGASGHRLPALTLPCLGGGPRVRLAALHGTPMLVNLWGSWCGPCQQEVPYLQKAYAAAAGRLRVLGVDTEDSRRSALDFAAHTGMHYPSVVDAQGAVKQEAGPKGLPVTLFVTAGGDVVHTKIGPFRTEAAVQSAVRRYLGIEF